MNTLLTPRLILDPMTPAEAERVVSLQASGAYRWAPGYPIAGDTVAATNFLRVCAERGDPQPFGNYAIRRRDDGYAIGGIGFHGPPDEAMTVVIGYGLIPTERGKGYASEALRALLDFARSRGIAQVLGDTAHDNVASQHVLAAAGLRLVGEDAELKYYAITLLQGR